MIESLTPKFVKRFPADLEDGEIYIAMEYGTAVHKCCCGCGSKVITPFGPTDWKLLYDGDTISLHPSIGNWNFPCQSHYWVRSNRVIRAPRMTRAEIDAGRNWDRDLKETFYAGKHIHEVAEPATTASINAKDGRPGFWKRIFSGL
jgi:hypothetical protein